MFRFTPRTIPSKIFVIGCGGTGSRLVPLLTQFIASISKDKNPRGWLDDPTIFLIDDDVVEQKNLQRQNFVMADVGKHKASVLAQRYGRAYGVNVVPVLKRVVGLNSGELFKDVTGDPSFYNSLVIMCVDTADARRAIINMVDYNSSSKDLGQGAFFIDAGNEDNFGQVRFFNHSACIPGKGLMDSKDIPKMSPIVLDLPAIPIDIDYYENLTDMPGQGSCADLDQTLAINAIMAAEIMGIVQNYYYCKPMTYYQVSLSLDGARSTTYLTANELLRINKTQAVSRYGKLSLYNMSLLNVGKYLERFKTETEKALAKMNATVVAEEAIEDVSKKTTEPAKSRSREAEVIEATSMESLPSEGETLEAPF